jgi:phospholipase C
MKSKLLSTVALTVIAAAIASSAPVSAGSGAYRDPNTLPTATPIKHVVVIFDENRSFDHYFATYPNATNPSGEIPFVAKPHTPTAANLATAKLLTNNPNNNPANGSGAANPFRLDRTQANTADQNHAYTPEQLAYDNGKADLFPLNTGHGTAGASGTFGTNGQVLGYFDGNTVTAMWNYAQYFAMSDNNYTDAYGPSTPGALGVVAGTTNGAVDILGTSGSTIPDGQGGLTLINDTDPAYDTCSSTTTTVMMTSKNIGDLLNAAEISWGGFMGGFDLTRTNINGTSGCSRSTYSSVISGTSTDYVPHHNWFQYYKSTSNPSHARPSSLQAIGHTLEPNGETLDPANHEYDLQDFYDALLAGNYPAVSYIKLPGYQDAHPGYSDPLDEQEGIVQVVNTLQQQPDWKNTLVIITYDDSDGWYDHLYAKPTWASYDPTADQVNGPGQCGTGVATQVQPNGVKGKPVNGRCGPGTRVPFIAISPYSKPNYISAKRLTQSSVIRFIEDNWLNGKRLGDGSLDATSGLITDMLDFTQTPNEKLFLDPVAGTVVLSAPEGH